MVKSICQRTSTSPNRTLQLSHRCLTCLKYLNEAVLYGTGQIRRGRRLIVVFNSLFVTWLTLERQTTSSVIWSITQVAHILPIARQIIELTIATYANTSPVSGWKICESPRIMDIMDIMESNEKPEASSGVTEKKGHWLLGTACERHVWKVRQWVSWSETLLFSADMLCITMM